VVIGFKTDPKPCGFMFRLTRGDGAPVDNYLYNYIRVYDSLGALQSTAISFDSDSRVWTVKLSSAEIDPDGYWVEYLCEDGILTGYPYRYKTADKRRPEDRILPGSYEDVIPFWKIGSMQSPEDIAYWETFRNLDEGGMEHAPPTGKYAVRPEAMVYMITEAMRMSLHVQSSVPWKATYKINQAFTTNYEATGRQYTSEPLDRFMDNDGTGESFTGSFTVKSDDEALSISGSDGLYPATSATGEWRTETDFNVYIELDSFGPYTVTGKPLEWDGGAWVRVPETWNFADYIFENLRLEMDVVYEEEA